MVEDHQRRHREAIVDMIAAYAVIMKLLTKLPLVIEIPSLRDTVFTDEIQTGLITAHNALQDLPMDPDAKQFLGFMILDWVVGADYLFRDEEEPNDWLIDIVEGQIERILVTGDLVADILSPPDEESDEG